MNPIPPSWQETRVIESFDVDILGRARPQMIFAYMLNGAWNHAKGSTYGFDELTSRNLIWVLVKFRIIFERIPVWGDTIQIETWGKRIERFYALRDFTIRSPSGERLSAATSAWMVVNRTNGRLQRLDQETDGFPWQPDRDEIITSIEKIEELTAPTELARFRVQFSDIDVNRHVNSTKYVQWIIDSHPLEFLEANDLQSIDMNFLAEALAADEVAVSCQGSANTELCCVRRISDNKELCRAKLCWRGR